MVVVSAAVVVVSSPAVVVSVSGRWYRCPPESSASEEFSSSLYCSITASKSPALVIHIQVFLQAVPHLLGPLPRPDQPLRCR